MSSATGTGPASDSAPSDGFVQLATANYRLTASPLEGGLVTAFQGRQGDTWHDILRPRPQASAFHGGIARFGCFAMVPFANRLPGAALPLEQGEVLFPVNAPTEPIALHGTAWGMPWRVDHVAPVRVSMSVPVRDRFGRVLGVAHQDIALDEVAGLQLVLSYRHGLSSAMMCGLGLHPWLYAPASTPPEMLRFIAGGHFEMGSDYLPVRHLDGPEMVALSREQDRHNVTYTGGDGAFELQRPSAGLTVAGTSDAGLLHCYVAAEYDSICAEPVTHRPNAAADQLADAPGTMRWLGRDEVMSIRLGLRLLPKLD